MVRVAALVSLLLSRGAALYAQCDVIVPPRELSPDVYATRRACEDARKRFTDVFGGHAATVRIVLVDEMEIAAGVRGGRITMRFPNTRQWEETAGQMGIRGRAAREFAREQIQRTLPHELAHQLTASFFFPGGLPDSIPYGTPLPDWLDEAAAISAEPDSARAERLTLARAVIGRKSLPELLLEQHPHAGLDTTRLSYTASRITTEVTPAGDTLRIVFRTDFRGSTRVDTLTTNTGIADTRELDAFYPLSYSLLAFVRATGGRPAMTELVRRVRANPDDTSLLNGLPGLPQATSEIDRAWRDWVATSVR